METVNMNFKTTHCVTCGCVIHIEESQYLQLRKSHKDYWCVNGHSQYFNGQDPERMLREQLSEARSEADGLRKELDRMRRKKALK